MTTHEVFNQSTPLEDHNAAELDLALLEGVRREGAGDQEADLRRVGAMVGDPAWIHRGDLANANPPVLHTHDRFGHRIDRV
ncbi:MAG: DNA alkylation response protein, partial [Aquihabitans sp.]